MISRRTFFKSSLIAGGLISTGMVFYSQIPEDDMLPNLTPLDLKFINENDRIVLLALIPVIVSGAEINAAKINTVIKNIDSSIQLFSEQSRADLRELFDLLSSKLGRAVVVGIWSSWNHAKPDDLVKFLMEWQNSFVDLFQVGYQGLKELVFSAYYSEKDNWAQIEYAGPPILF